MPILYKDGYKYQLYTDYSVRISIKPESDVFLDYIRLSTDGMLLITEGYCWDGPSGITYDSENFMRGSLVHDALYQLLRCGKLPESCRLQCDEELVKIRKEDGMSAFRRWYVKKALKAFGGPAADPKNKKEIFQAGR